MANNEPDARLSVYARISRLFKFCFVGGKRRFADSALDVDIYGTLRFILSSVRSLGDGDKHHLDICFAY